MTARLDVTPKTTEQNRIVCTSKCQAGGTNNNNKNCACGIALLTQRSYTDRHEASRGLFATAELLVMVWRHVTARSKLSDLLLSTNVTLVCDLSDMSSPVTLPF